MSFVRVPRRSQSLSGRSRKPKKKKATWDSTTSDLTVHKLSKDELDRRHAVHQSANLEIIKEEKRKKAILKARKERSQSEGSQAGLLQEILYDEKQLNAALAHSDRVMSVVKDLFYDDPKRLKAIPLITRAPGGDADRRRGGPIKEKGPHTSYLDTLSDSIMDPSALNEYQQDIDSQLEEEETDDDDEEDGETPVFDSKLDVDRFQSYIHRSATQKPVDERERANLRHGSNNKENMDPVVTPERLPLAKSQQDTINDTAKANKKMGSKSKSKSQSSFLEISQKTKPEDLRMYLNELMTACSAFDQVRGEADISHTFTSGFPHLSGYTAFLVQTLTKILKHLTQSEANLEQERAAKQRLEQETAQQRKLIDAMTVDMMQSQELNMKIQAEARKHINQMEQRLQIVEHLLANREFLEEKVEPCETANQKEALGSRPTQPSKSASTMATAHSEAIRSSDIKQDQQTDPHPGPTQITTSASGSLPAVSLVESTLPTRTSSGQTIVTGQPGDQSSTSQVQSTAVSSFITSRNNTTAGNANQDATGHQDTGGHQVPQLSQHTVEKLMSTRPGQERDDVHFSGNLRSIQTNVPIGIQNSGLFQSGDGERAMHRPSSKSGFSISSMPSSVQKGTNLTSQGSRLGPFGSSRQQESSDFHLRPIQPAMLLSPPRQKDRRDFIKPPGYQSQLAKGAPHVLTHGGISNPTSTLSGGVKGSTFQPQAVFLGTRSKFSGDPSLDVNRNDFVNPSGYPPREPLLNNYTSDPDGLREGVSPTLSVGSSSTRYLSLPGIPGETNMIKNILHHGNTNPSLLQPDRPGPNGQDQQQHQPLRNVHPMTMDTVYEASLDGSVEPAGREDTSVDMNEKIASLSRQRVEAQARLEHLKDMYGGEERPTTSGREATENKIPTKPTGVLIGASPPVSPISREPPSQRPLPTGTSRNASAGRTIHVSMPKLSELEISATSTPASKRTSTGSSGPSPGINQNDWKTPLKDSPGKEEFFALKAHIST
ncbi:uncharacterized protein LOC121423838 [Lytechinus variegatus]|uniref:uncharacterized protein LOC121423838 n=1 Tax=Lytechinus variegatus TaxID=7654 RepID=UPI001BB2B905|nr:uncharacterized protein LOC121423838 [Lytechinus variegatus]